MYRYSTEQIYCRQKSKVACIHNNKKAVDKMHQHTHRPHQLLLLLLDLVLRELLLPVVIVVRVVDQPLEDVLVPGNLVHRLLLHRGVGRAES